MLCREAVVSVAQVDDDAYGGKGTASVWSPSFVQLVVLTMVLRYLDDFALAKGLGQNFAKVIALEVRVRIRPSPEGSLIELKKACYADSGPRFRHKDSLEPKPSPRGVRHMEEFVRLRLQVSSAMQPDM